MVCNTIARCLQLRILAGHAVPTARDAQHSGRARGRRRVIANAARAVVFLAVLATGFVACSDDADSDAARTYFWEQDAFHGSPVVLPAEGGSFVPSVPAGASPGLEEPEVLR